MEIWARTFDCQWIKFKMSEMFNAEVSSVRSWVTLSARTRGQPRFWMHVTLTSSATDEQTYPISAHWSQWNWYQLAENNLVEITFYGIFFFKNVYCSISKFRLTFVSPEFPSENHGIRITLQNSLSMFSESIAIHFPAQLSPLAKRSETTWLWRGSSDRALLR